MICPACKKGEFVVVRTLTEGFVVVRYRACQCGYRGKTVEVAELVSNTGNDPLPKEGNARV